jgi:hypothetical protein
VLPTFLVVGAPRCATTSLHYYLRQHPDVTMSATKEPNHFLFAPGPSGPRPLVAPDRRIVGKSVADRAAYERLFRVTTERAVGEASPLYLSTEGSAEQAAAACPDLRAVAVVREPVERAWSHFVYMDTGPAATAEHRFLDHVRHELPLPDEPYRPGMQHLRLGRYAHQLDRWRSVLGRDRVQVVDYRQLVTDPADALARICRFVGVEPSSAIDTTTRYNPSVVGGGGRLDRVVAPLRPTLKRVLPAGVAGAAARRRADRRAGQAGAASGAPRQAYELLASYYAEDRNRLLAEDGIDLAPTPPVAA